MAFYEEDSYDSTDGWQERVKDLLSRRRGMTAEESAVAQVKIADEMFAAGAMGLPERVFSISMGIERVVEDRVMNNLSPALVRLSEQIKNRERDYGLIDGEYLEKADQPEDISSLHADWTSIYSTLHAAAFDEFGASDVGALYRNDRARYDELRESGRRYFFEQKTQH